MKIHVLLYNLAHYFRERHERRVDGCAHQWVTTSKGGYGWHQCLKCGKQETYGA